MGQGVHGEYHGLGTNRADMGKRAAGTRVLQVRTFSRVILESMGD
jgi:hypothetical protein